MNSLENWFKLSVIEFDFFSVSSTKKLLEKSRSFYFRTKRCLHNLGNKRKSQIAKQSEFLWAVFQKGPTNEVS